MDTLTARMPNPATIIPEAMKPIQALFGSISGGGVPQATLELVHLRVSQVNGCSPCVDGGWRKVWIAVHLAASGLWLLGYLAHQLVQWIAGRRRAAATSAATGA